MANQQPKKYNSPTKVRKEDGFMQSIKKWVAPVLIGASLLGTPGCDFKPLPSNEAASVLSDVKYSAEISNRKMVDMNYYSTDPYYYPQYYDRELKDSREKLVEAKKNLEIMAQCERIPLEKRKLFGTLAERLGNIEVSVSRGIKEDKGKEVPRGERYQLKKEHEEMIKILDTIDREIKYFDGVGPQEYGLRPKPNLAVPIILASIVALLLISTNITGFVISDSQKTINLVGAGFFFLWIILLLIVIKKMNR
jgi:hypothetical protein